jgi:hypothetical protein
MNNHIFKREDQDILGTIVSGSLADGLSMRIDPRVDLEELKTGRFVCIQGRACSFFSLIDDLKLNVSHPDILLFPPADDEYLLKDALHAKDIYATALLRPRIMMLSDGSLKPVKTIPEHFTRVYKATHRDIQTIFGHENDQSRKFFSIGNPLDMSTPVCLDFQKLTERSNGIFGKTGTGKTFLTRLVLAGLIYRKQAVNIIFDMHGEYGFKARKEGEGAHFVKGLGQLFPSKVKICSIDATSKDNKNRHHTESLIFSYDSIDVEDIITLQKELNLNPTAYEAAYLIRSKYGKKWLSTLLSSGSEIKELAENIGAHPESIGALYRKLKKIEQFPFLTKEPALHDKSIDKMMENIEHGVSIIVEFGKYTSTLCYLLVCNIITRRIHKLYIQRTEKYLRSGHASDEPQRLMIVIEEAHKFLNTQIAKQTIFGIIAREMRKYYVSLLIVDQRPSEIDPEILSQVGTKIIAQLNDEKDIQAVVTGSSHTSELRGILSGLESKKQVLVTGHAVTMPVVIESRTYDEAFYKAVSTQIKTSDIY